MMGIRGPRLWLLIIASVYSSHWLRPSESARGVEKGDSEESQVSVCSDRPSRTTEQRPDGSIVPATRKAPPLPRRQRHGSSLRDASAGTEGSTCRQQEATDTQRNETSDHGISGCTDTSVPDQTQRQRNLVYDIPRSYGDAAGVNVQRRRSKDYDIPRSIFEDSLHGTRTQRHPKDYYDIPRASEYAHGKGTTLERSKEMNRQRQTSRSSPEQDDKNSVPHGSTNYHTDINPQTTDFDWLRDPGRLASGNPSLCRRGPGLDSGSNYNTVASSRPRSSASSTGSRSTITYTLPRSSRRDDRRRDNYSRGRDPAAGVMCEPERQFKDPRGVIEIIDPPDSPPEKPLELFAAKPESRGFFSHLWGKVRSASARKRATSKARSVDTSTPCNKTKVDEALKQLKRSTSVPERALPPLPVPAPESPDGTGGMSYHVRGFDPNIFDDAIRRELSPRLLDTVLSCEQRVLEALDSGTLAHLLSDPEELEDFMLLAGVIAHYSKRLHLTPVEDLFVMWVRECSRPFQCPPEVLLEMISVFEFIAGTKRLEVPAAVKLLLSSGYNRNVGGRNARYQPVQLAEGIGSRVTLPRVAFTLFLHRISPEAVRREIAREVAESWPDFIRETSHLLVTGNLKKSLDYPGYRTRFIVYAYTASAVVFQPGNAVSGNPLEEVLQLCYMDTDFLRRIADPEVRSRFFENVRQRFPMRS